MPSPLPPPPRRVSLSVWFAATLGGPLSQIGWLVFGFGMLFAWIFVGNSELFTPIKFSGELGFAEGSLVSFSSTGASENETTIYEVAYSFEANGQTWPGHSYTMDTSAPAVPLAIEYRLDAPNISRVEGLRAGMFGWGVVFVLIFPGIGLMLALFSIVRGLRAVRVLRIGREAHGRLVSKEATNVSINEQPVFELTFEFEDERGMVRSASTRSHVTDALEDDAVERFLYDPNNPDRTTFLDDLPGGVSIQGGAFVGRLLPVFIPGLVVAVNIAYALHRVG